VIISLCPGSFCIKREELKAVSVSVIKPKTEKEKN